MPHRTQVYKLATANNNENAIENPEFMARYDEEVTQAPRVYCLW